jgi:hypothetical protein
MSDSQSGLSEGSEKRTRETGRFVLVVCEEFCFWLTRDRFQMMVNFSSAVQNARTWGDFRCICGPEALEYIRPFLEVDDDIGPEDEDLLCDVWEHVFVLYDSETPLTQCAEETTGVVRGILASTYIMETISTEYGAEIDLYSIDRIDFVLNELSNLGCFVEKVNCPFAVDLRNYGR